LIWLGDLNYRIPQPAEPVKAKVAKKLLRALLRSDQVRTRPSVLWGPARRTEPRAVGMRACLCMLLCGVGLVGRS
jgi:hypothetical protein